jgi:glycosyltransferase involved in cell wall biosynthesis
MSLNASNYPRVTVVTISFNAEKFIRSTLESVLAQDYPNLEYFVIDGASKDSTPAIIREYAEQGRTKSQTITWWISEPDSGVTEAFNKGIARSTGEYIGFMNAGDYFATDDALSRLFRVYDTAFPADVIYGKARLTFEYAPEKIVGANKLPRYKMPTAHQAMYYHHSVWQRFGHFPDDYRYAMDYEHYQRMRGGGAQFAFADVIVAERPLTSARNSFGNPSRTYREYIRADAAHLNPAILLNSAKFLRDVIKEHFR